jgi:N6-adenosine-specific RNA methylase IME4
MEFPSNKLYNIILIDPAWTYKDKALAGNRGAGCKYNLMTTEDIKQLPINSIADKDCVLFCWVTYPKLNEVFDVIKAWGFEYKTVAFTWVKKYKNGDNFMGMGRWTRANAEICLLCTKGKPKRVSASVRQVVETIPERHSKKPDIVRDKIVELCGDLPKIELFARKRAENWDCWGDDQSLNIEDTSIGEHDES